MSNFSSLYGLAKLLRPTTDDSIFGLFAVCIEPNYFPRIKLKESICLDRTTNQPFFNPISTGEGGRFLLPNTLFFALKRPVISP